MTLGVLSSRSALSMLVGALFKKFGLYLNTPCIVVFHTYIYMFRLYLYRREEGHNVNGSEYCTIQLAHTSIVIIRIIHRIEFKLCSSIQTCQGQYFTDENIFMCS
jgi:hypothetical protein